MQHRCEAIQIVPNEADDTSGVFLPQTRGNRGASLIDRALLSVVLAISCIASPASFSGETPSKAERDREVLLQERNEAWENAVRDLSKKEPAQARQNFAKALELQRLANGDPEGILKANESSLLEPHQPDGWTDPMDAQRQRVRLAKLLFGPADFRIGDARRAIIEIQQARKRTERQRESGVNADFAAQVFHSHFRQHRFADAIEVGLRIVQWRKESVGEAHEDYARSLSNLGAAYRENGDLANAKRYLEKALVLRKEIFGTGHPIYAGSLNSLATLHQSAGEFTKARPRFEAAVEILRKTRGRLHSGYVTTLANLANLCVVMGDTQSAKRYYLESVEVRTARWR